MDQTIPTPASYRGALALLIGLILLGCVPDAAAEPLYRVTLPEGSVITLYGGKCEMKEVINLPNVATWEEKGKTFSGCWGINPVGIVSFYFVDKTVIGIPGQMFKKVTGV